MNLQEYFEEHRKVALAFSGGTDSAYLLYAAVTAGADVRPYFVRSAFQPAFELSDARRVTDALSVPLTVLSADVFRCPDVVKNAERRCYYCKRTLFAALLDAARADGYPLLLDGTNASDDASDRPGMKALEELGVASPLRECGLTKADVRRLSREAGLFTWDKPAYACLATRIPTGTPITREALERTERAETLLSRLGFTDFRVRTYADAARIQLPAPQWGRLVEKREEVLRGLSGDYSGVFLDLQAR